VPSLRAAGRAPVLCLALAGGAGLRVSPALAQGRSPSQLQMQLTDESCAAAYERAQEHRRLGRLIRAREQLLACSQTSCPGFVVNDCRKWFDEVDTALPTVAFAVRQGGRDLEAVRVYRDGVLLTSRLDGRALPVDPGKHTFTIDVPGAGRRTIEALIVEGKKNRLMEVELASAVTASSAGARPVTPGPASPEVLARAQVATRPAPSVATWSFAAVGAAGLAGFAGFGLAGWREERNMRDRCAPLCSSSEVNGVRRTYMLADVSLGLGLGSLAVAGYLYLRGVPATGSSGSSGSSGSMTTGLHLGDGRGGFQLARTF
jgi:hypothetical protein